MKVPLTTIAIMESYTVLYGISVLPWTAKTARFLTYVCIGGILLFIVLLMVAYIIVSRYSDKIIDGNP